MMLTSLRTSQSATLLSADITSVGVATASLAGGPCCFLWRVENLVTWSLIFIFPGVPSSNSMVKEAWLWTTGGVEVGGGEQAGGVSVSLVGTSWTWWTWWTCGPEALCCWRSLVGISK